MGDVLRPLPAHIEHEAVALEKYFCLLEVVPRRHTRLDSFLTRLRFLQNDVDDASHRLAAVERRCRALDDLDALDHGGGYIFRTRIVLEIHRHAVDHDKRAPVIAAQRDASCAEAEILSCLAVGRARRADLLVDRLKYVAIACLFDVLRRDDRRRRGRIEIALPPALRRHERIGQIMAAVFCSFRTLFPHLRRFRCRLSCRRIFRRIRLARKAHARDCREHRPCQMFLAFHLHHPFPK